MAAVLLSAAAVAACSSGTSSSGGAAGGASGGAAATVGPQNSATPKAGGSFTMLEETGLTGVWPTGLDPATDGNGSANQSYLNAIYGNLFELGANGQTIDDLATGYTITPDGKTVTRRRPGPGPGTWSRATSRSWPAIPRQPARPAQRPASDKHEISGNIKE